MKNILILIFATLIFACQSQTYNHPESTLEDFNSEQIISNNLKSIKEYWRVPSTNRDSLIEPIGLMLVRESYFNKTGHLKKTRCVNCAVQSHGDQPHIDFIRTLEYEGEILTKYGESEFDTTLFEVQYFKSKSLTKGYRDGKLGYASIETYDSIGRVTKQLVFEFFGSYENEQNVLQVFLSKVTYEYDPETTYIQSLRQTGNVNMVTLTKEQFASLNSNSIENIEGLTQYYKLESQGTEIIKSSKSGDVLHRQMHNTTYPEETSYQYDESGLLKVKINKYNGHEFVSEYLYEKW